MFAWLGNKTQIEEDRILKLERLLAIIWQIKKLRRDQAGKSFARGLWVRMAEVGRGRAQEH